MAQAVHLYVWHSVLEDYSSGIAAAIASSVEEARKAILAEARAKSDAAIRHLEEDIAPQPSIYKAPHGVYCHGGG